MKILGPTFLGILLSAVSVCGQQRIQDFRAFTDMVKETSHRPAEIIKEPAILGVGKTWAVVSWTTNATGKGHSRIYAGTDPGNLKPVNETPAANGKNDRVQSYAQQEYAHLVRLNNLKPGTTYYFRADSGNNTNRGVESESHTWAFTTMAHEPRSVGENTQLAGMSSIAKPAAKMFMAHNVRSSDTQQRRHFLRTKVSTSARVLKSERQIRKPA